MARVRPFRLTAPVVREHPLQKQLADVLRLEFAPAGKVSRHGVTWFSIDHANYAGEVPGVRIGRGIIAGIMDIFILFRGQAHFIEVKAADGVLSDRQKSVAAAVIVAGGQVGIARDAAELLACCDTWKLPRNRRVRMEAV